MYKMLQGFTSASIGLISIQERTKDPKRYQQANITLKMYLVSDTLYNMSQNMYLIRSDIAHNLNVLEIHLR
jgi:hypothetical protein